MLKIRDFLSLIRAKQYIKNLIIFAPLFFGQQLFNMKLFMPTLVSFFAFSMIASFIYIVNDIVDMSQDRPHPQKSLRALVSGKITVKTALIIAFLMLSTGLLVEYAINIKALYVFLAYIFLNIFYCYKGKYIAILDIFIVSFGYILRLMIGAACTNIFLSKWIIIITFLLGIFLVISKRRNDIKYIDLNVRKNLDNYNLQFIDITMGILIAVTIVSYIQYTISFNVMNYFQNEYLYITTIFVLFGLLRYLQVALVKNESYSPVELFYKDRFLQLTFLGWVITFLWMIYL